ncbi:MAG: rRNA adenine N-6-methyltransferase family protein [Bacteroidota bacterium]
MNRLKFFLEGVKNMKTRGTVAPTSRFTSEQMLKHVNFEEAELIVELGAGDGQITKHILKKMDPATKLLSFEINDEFCQELRSIRDSRLEVVHDCAENLNSYLSREPGHKADYIISGIPFVMLPNDLGDRILEISKASLKPGGRFIQFHYSLIPKKRYHKIFDSVDIEFEVRNLPPAFVFICH